MSEAIRQGELIGRGLMAYETTEEVGRVDHLLVDVKRSHAVGITYKVPGLIARKQSISWQNLVKIGGDRILIRIESAADDAELAAAQNMTGLEIWTDGGDRIGTLIDIRLDRDTGKVQQYLFSLEHEPPQSEPRQNTRTESEQPSPNASPQPEDGITDASLSVTVYAIEPQMIISAGRKRMMIAEEDARRAQSQREVIERSRTKPPVDRPIPALPTEIPAALPTDIGKLFQQGKTFAENATQQAKERAKHFTEERLANQDFLEAETLPDITEQLQAKTAQAKQQIQQQLSKAAERAEKAKEQVDGRLGQSSFGRSSFGRSLGNSLNQAFDKIKRPPANNADPIDVDAFEVWEDD
ncbi:MAG: PRC-barrel domain-containing protein [Phormidesmis sp.]